MGVMVDMQSKISFYSVLLAFVEFSSPHPSSSCAHNSAVMALCLPLTFSFFKLWCEYGMQVAFYQRFGV